MDKQLDLFESKKRRDIGIDKALKNANTKTEKWSKYAYDFLLGYIKTKKTFLAEDVRVASSGVVPEPPSKRAWGSIFVMAKKNNLIKSIGYRSVKNPKAHRTPATLWKAN